LKVFGPDRRLLGTVAVHASNCCFGGGDFRTLFITSVDKFLALPTRVVGIKPPPLQARG
jgi:gluconolactonase